MASATYEAGRGDYRLTTFRDTETDAQVRSAIEGGEQVEADTVLQYVRRKAARALESGGAEDCVDALKALATIDGNSVDLRDVAWAASIAKHVGIRLGVDAADLFGPALRAAGSIGSVLEDVSTRIDDLTDWGYRIVERESGAILVPWAYAPWEPAHDLLGVALRLADAIDPARYLMDDPEGGIDLPTVWLRPSPFLKRRLAALRGVVKISGSRADVPPGRRVTQRLLIFVGEAKDARAARWLAGRPQRGLSGRTVLAQAVGPHFVVVVGGSWEVGVQGDESAASLQTVLQLAVGAIVETTDGPEDGPS